MANLIRPSNDTMHITWRQSTDRLGKQRLNFILHGKDKVIGKASMTADQIAGYILKNSILKDEDTKE